jgi:hypothetical protein
LYSLDGEVALEKPSSIADIKRVAAARPLS